MFLKADMQPSELQPMLLSAKFVGTIFAFRQKNRIQSCFNSQRSPSIRGAISGSSPQWRPNLEVVRGSIRETP